VPTTLSGLIGALIGVRIAHAARADQLRLLATTLCIVSAVRMVVETPFR
jgi:uncharacterized membrane protein YfcA